MQYIGVFAGEMFLSELIFRLFALICLSTRVTSNLLPFINCSVLFQLFPDEVVDLSALHWSAIKITKGTGFGLLRSQTDVLKTFEVGGRN